MGAIICLLFLFGAFLSKKRTQMVADRYYLIRHHPFLGKEPGRRQLLLFDYLPFYKKFRAPSMALR